MNICEPVVFIVDDDPSVREILTSILGRKYEILTACDGKECLDILKDRRVDIAFLDINLPDTNGIALLEIIKKYYPSTDVVMLSIVQDISVVVEAVKKGAFDYVNKEIEPTKILHLVDILKEKRAKDAELEYLRDELSLYVDKELVFGKTAKMLRIKELIERIKDLPTTVLIRGETGTGKELIAREIHKTSVYKDCPFVSVNLSAIPGELIESTLFGHEKGAFTGALRQNLGKFELANRGILFLDEIGELEYSLQAKLLRVMQEGEIERVGSNRTIKLDVRLIAATSRDLEAMMRDGKFREDLYYRLNVIPVRLPPLRERVPDIRTLTDLFITRYCRKFSKRMERISPGAVKCLEGYSWPGNIRELENLIERIVAVSNRCIIDESDIPIEYLVNSFRSLCDMGSGDGGKDFLKKSIDAFERSVIMKCLDMHGGSRQKTAGMLGIPISTLKFKIKKLNICTEVKNGVLQKEFHDAL